MRGGFESGGRFTSTPSVERLEERQLFALAVVHQELHRPPLVMFSAGGGGGGGPAIIEQTVGKVQGPDARGDRSVFGFQVWTPNGQGDYAPAGQFDVGGQSPGSDVDAAIAVGDLNGDGFTDVAMKLFSVTGQPTPVGEAVSERIVPFVNDGKGGFVEAPSIPLEEGFTFHGKKGYDYYQARSQLASVDLDGDKRADIVSWTDTSISTLLSSEQMKFAHRQEFGQTLPTRHERIAGPGDLDGDGTAELASYDEVSGKVIVRGWDPKKKEWIAGSAAAGPAGFGPVTDIRVGDFNGDGLTDLVLFSDGSYSIGTNVTKFDPAGGNGPVYGFSWGTARVLPPQMGSEDVGVGDVDGDGGDDLFAFKHLGHVTIVKHLGHVTIVK